MSQTHTHDDRYLLGHDPEELERLEHQAAILAPATDALLRMAGIGPGMRVLDLGAGPGDVALATAELVGPGGEVVGVDRAAEVLVAARARAEARGATNIRFQRGDIRDFGDGQFDAVVGRLVLLYANDPVSVIRHHAASLRPGGVVLAMEYDLRAARVIGDCPITATALRWAVDTFDRAGFDDVLGPRLAGVLQAAGLNGVGTLGIQPYLAPEAGAEMLAGIVRTLLAAIEQTGVATAAEVDLATLQPRLATEMRAQDAVLVPPTLASAWASVPD